MPNEAERSSQEPNAFVEGIYTENAQRLRGWLTAICRDEAAAEDSNILGKLGVDSRVEAAAVAHRIGVGKDAPPPPDAA
jgi:hypothetical protein